MKNTKIMAILAVFLVAVLCVGAVSAAPEDLSFSIENDTGAVTAEFTAGETIVVNITGTGNADKLNVTYNGETKTNTTAISATGSKFEFTAVVGQTEIKFENYTGAVEGYTVGGQALPWTTSITVNPVPAPSIPQINVNAAAPGSEIVEGTVVLVSVVDNQVTPLQDGVVFSTAAGDELITENGGQITVESTTPSGLYQNTTYGYNVTVKTGTAATDIVLDGASSVIVGDEYSLTIGATGSYVGDAATINWGDGTATTTIASLAATQTESHEYATAGTYTVTVTVGTQSFTQSVTIVAGDRKVNTTLHDAAFVYETVRVVDGNGAPVTKLYFYSSDATPALIATLASETGTYELLEAAVNGHYGAWYAAPITGGQLSDEYITIWYPEKDHQQEHRGLLLH